MSNKNKMVMTLDLARAVAWDAASANMRKHCRKAWNEEDSQVATDKLARLIEIGNFYPPEITKQIIKDMRVA